MSDQSQQELAGQSLIPTMPGYSGQSPEEVAGQSNVPTMQGPARDTPWTTGLAPDALQPYGFDVPLDSMAGRYHEFTQDVPQDYANIDLGAKE